MSNRETDIVIDLETLGHRQNAAIVSIGAAALNRNTGKIGPLYYNSVNLDTALRCGAVTGGTLAWWMHKDRTQGARAVFNDPKAVTLYEALRGLNDFVRGRPSGACVWGNGSHFDISILEHAYDAIGMPGFTEQWKFWSVRDLRTILDTSGFDKKSIPFVGYEHHALDDAVHEAKVLAGCFGKQWSMTQILPTAEGEDW